MTRPGITTEKYALNKSGHDERSRSRTAATRCSSSLAYDYSYISGTTKHGSLIHAVTDQAGQKTTYTYKDAAVPEDVGRLVKARTETSGSVLVEQFSYTYDPAGNRLTAVDQTGSTTTTTMAYNAANQLCWKYTGTSANACGSPPTGATSYGFDTAIGHGNETSAGATSYSYDARDRATGLAAPPPLLPDNGELVSYGTTSYQNNLLGLSRQIGTQHHHQLRPQPRRRPHQPTHQHRQTVLPQRRARLHHRPDRHHRRDRALLHLRPRRQRHQHRQRRHHRPQIRRRTPNRHPLPLRRPLLRPATARWTQQDPIQNYTDLTQANRYGYAAGDPINAVDPRGTNIIDDVDNFIEDNAKELTKSIECGAAVAVGSWGRVEFVSNFTARRTSIALMPSSGAHGAATS